MSLLPVFKIGLWNAWIFMLYMLLLSPLMMVNKGSSRDEIRKADGARKSQFTDSHMYLTPFLIFMGVGIAAASWVMLLCSLAFILLPPLFVRPEERFLLEKYGDSYQAYMDRTPRWVGIPKKDLK